jgi:hypothetical protein
MQTNAFNLSECPLRADSCLPGRAGLRPLALPLAPFAVAICNSSYASTPVRRCGNHASDFDHQGLRSCDRNALFLGSPRHSAPALSRLRALAGSRRNPDTVRRSENGLEAYLPIARSAIALSIAALTADMLKLAPPCIGGKSIRVCAAFATSF